MRHLRVLFLAAAATVMAMGGCAGTDRAVGMGGPGTTGENWPVASMAVIRVPGNAPEPVPHRVSVRAHTSGDVPASDGTEFRVTVTASELDGPATYPVSRFITNGLQSDGTTLADPLEITGGGRGSIVFKIATDWQQVANRVVIEYTIHPTAGTNALKGCFIVEKPSPNSGDEGGDTAP